jgi:hypothetical protein
METWITTTKEKRNGNTEKLQLGIAETTNENSVMQWDASFFKNFS